MKKITKITTAAVLLAALVSSGVFAAEGKNSDGKNRRMARDGNRPERGMDDKRPMFDEDAVIGQVKSVDAKNNKIKITDADGNVTEYAVTGFTKIMVMKKPDFENPAPDSGSGENQKSKKSGTKSLPAEDNENRPDFSERRGPRGFSVPESTLNDVKEGSWVMFSVVDGTTKTKQISRLIVKDGE